MTRSEIVAELRSLLLGIAPDADVAELALDADVREALDIDSMDFLNFAVAVSRRWGISVPQADTPKLATLDGAAAFIERSTAG
jgi:acyl carrier protein